MLFSCLSSSLWHLFCVWEMCQCAPGGQRRSVATSFLFLCGSWGLNLGHQTRWQDLYLLSHLIGIIFNDFNEYACTVRKYTCWAISPCFLLLLMTDLYHTLERFFDHLLIFVCVYMFMCHGMHLESSEQLGGVFSFHYVVSKDQTQVIRTGKQVPLPTE